MPRHTSLWVASLVFSATLLNAAEKPGDDIVFKALVDEAARSMTLRLEGLDGPYFIEYEVSDATTYRVSAAYGALTSSDRNQGRT